MMHPQTFWYITEKYDFFLKSLELCIADLESPQELIFLAGALTKAANECLVCLDKRIDGRGRKE